MLFHKGPGRRLTDEEVTQLLHVPMRPRHLPEELLGFGVDAYQNRFLRGKNRDFGHCGGVDNVCSKI